VILTRLVSTPSFLVHAASARQAVPPRRVVYKEKADGWRMLAYKDDGRVLTEALPGVTRVAVLRLPGDQNDLVVQDLEMPLGDSICSFRGFRWRSPRTLRLRSRWPFAVAHKPP
jgi:hypothetical protein